MTKKLAFSGVAVFLAFFFIAPFAHADTISNLETELQALLTQVNSLQAAAVTAISSPPVAAVKPTCHVTLSATSVMPDQQSTITWSSTNALYMTEASGLLGGKGNLPANGQSTSSWTSSGLSAPYSKTYTLVFHGALGVTATCSVTQNISSSESITESSLHPAPNTPFTLSGIVSLPTQVVIVGPNYKGSTDWGTVSQLLKGDGPAVAAAETISGTNWSANFGALKAGTYTVLTYDSQSNLLTVGTLTTSGAGITSNALTVGTPTTAVTVVNNGSGVTTQTGNFTFTFNVTAGGETLYVYGGPAGFEPVIHSSGTGTSSVPTAEAVSSTASRTADGNFLIPAGQTESLTVTASKVGGGGQFYYATLDHIQYGPSDSTAYSNLETLPSTFTTAAVVIES